MTIVKAAPKIQNLTGKVPVKLSCCEGHLLALNFDFDFDF
jgi:hypothetical protein